MTAVDTNVVIRFLTRDDEAQALRATEVLRESDCFVPVTVLLESVWVLESIYDFPPARVHAAMEALLGLPNLTVGASAAVRLSLNWYAEGMDFADALHLALSQPSSRMVTFGEAFIQAAEGNGRCPVEQPG